MYAVDRAHFCRHNAYMDSPQGIDYGVTISAPHMVREIIDISPKQKKKIKCTSIKCT